VRYNGNTKKESGALLFMAHRILFVCGFLFRLLSGCFAVCVSQTKHYVAYFDEMCYTFVDYPEYGGETVCRKSITQNQNAAMALSLP
ncbi:MAG: hypothetical protein IJC18_01375, partial [Clostridia bacterium]|nr:hypothetical protein [Clostridia bacterium]